MQYCDCIVAPIRKKNISFALFFQLKTIKQEDERVAILDLKNLLTVITIFFVNTFYHIITILLTDDTKCIRNEKNYQRS